MDVKMNAFGVRVDKELTEGALYIDEVSREALMEEAMEITGIDNPNSTAQLMKWLERNGTETDNLRKATVSDLLAGQPAENVKRMLEIRQQLGKTSVKKYEAIRNAKGADGRVRGLTQYYGANRTGRWQGAGFVQMQNLPRNYLGTLDGAEKDRQEEKL